MQLSSISHTTIKNKNQALNTLDIVYISSYLIFYTHIIYLEYPLLFHPKVLDFKIPFTVKLLKFNDS